MEAWNTVWNLGEKMEEVGWVGGDQPRNLCVCVWITHGQIWGWGGGRPNVAGDRGWLEEVDEGGKYM